MRRCRASKAPNAASAGFTLMEVMVSLAIIAGMMTLLWGSFALTARSKTRVEEIQGRYHQLRLGMNRMAREISMAFLSKNDMMGTERPRTMFIGKRGSSIDELLFSSFAHMRLEADAKESDQSLIRYYGAPDPQDRSVRHLMRRESNRLGVEDPEEDGPAYVMIERIRALRFEYFDEQNDEWQESWNTTSADGEPDRLPTKIRIWLTVVNEAGKEVTLVTSTRTYVKDPLWFSSGT